MKRRAILATALVALLAGCQVSYYGQAVRGQMEIWSKQRPVDKLLARPSTPPELKDRLRLAGEILAFAESDLLLPAGGNYSSYADLHRPYVLWSVFATPELSVKAVSWDYPVVGSLDYRGYFSEKRAQSFAAARRAEGLDAAVVPVPAYSTLGWFKDPLLNTFLDDKPEELASLIFHELTHKKYYRAGDTSFSEALAVSVEQEGVRRWLRSHGDTEGLARHERRLNAIDDFVHRILKTRAELAAVYESSVTDEVKRQRKHEILGALQTEVRRLITTAGKTPEESFWLRDELGNAHLNVISAYYLRVPEFAALLEKCDGDLERFYDEVTRLP